MVIEKNETFQGFNLHCDKCSYYEEYFYCEWLEMTGDAKKKGWLFKYSSYDNGEWEHYCPECAREIT